MLVASRDAFSSIAVKDIDDELDLLTDRERDVLGLVAEGHTNREIAKVFHLSEQTVHNYRANIMEKIGVREVASLTRWCIQVGLADS